MLTRERRTELLALAEPHLLIEIADGCLEQDGDLTVLRHPEVGTIAAQVREPVAGERFLLGDVLVCRSEVLLRGHRGWAMRLGSDRAATLAAAICDAELESAGALADRVVALCLDTERAREAAADAEWARLAPTIVEFEDIP